MHRSLLKQALLLAASIAAAPAEAQLRAIPTDTIPVAAPDTDTAGGVRPRLGYRWNGANVWGGASIETRNASHNEHFAGSMKIVGVQFSHDVLHFHRIWFAYLGEVLPALMVRSGAPSNRKPNPGLNPKLLDDAARLQRFEIHDSYGFGLAPFGTEITAQLDDNVTGIFGITAGAALFTHVVPYGDATKANFTVSPGTALQWTLPRNTQVAVGYTFHHLSNASFGKSNPGMNSQILFVRIAHLDARPVRN